MSVARIVTAGRRAVVVAALTALTGCAVEDEFRQASAGYVPDAAAKTAAVDWSRAETATVTLSEFEFAPARMTFRANVPYRLRIRNVGGRDHTFASEGFYKAIAAAKLVSHDGETATPNLASVAVRPGEEKEVFFVPVKAGAYPLECSVFLHAAFGMEGRIVIE